MLNICEEDLQWQFTGRTMTIHKDTKSTLRTKGVKGLSRLPGVFQYLPAANPTLSAFALDTGICGEQWGGRYL